ncbi:MAG: hypothetical protein AAB885_03505, partial [Patescibacteria group bacterium]
MRSNKGIAEISPYPEGLRLFCRIVALRLSRSSHRYSFIAAPCASTKLLATRIGSIFKMGSRQNHDFRVYGIIILKGRLNVQNKLNRA